MDRKKKRKGEGEERNLKATILIKTTSKHFHIKKMHYIKLHINLRKQHESMLKQKREQDEEEILI